MGGVVQRNVTFRLAGGHAFVYEAEVARRREAPRREFFRPGAGRFPREVRIDQQ